MCHAEWNCTGLWFHAKRWNIFSNKFLLHHFLDACSETKMIFFPCTHFWWTTFNVLLRTRMQQQQKFFKKATAIWTLLPAGLANHCAFHHSPKQHIFYETCSLNVEQTAKEIEREGTAEFNFNSSETQRAQHLYCTWICPISCPLSPHWRYHQRSSSRLFCLLLSLKKVHNSRVSKVMKLGMHNISADTCSFLMLSFSAR